MIEVADGVEGGGGGVRRSDVATALRRMRDKGKGAALMRSWMHRAPAAPPDQEKNDTSRRAEEEDQSSS